MASMGLSTTVRHVFEWVQGLEAQVYRLFDMFIDSDYLC